MGFASGWPDSNPGPGSYQLWTEDISYLKLEVGIDKLPRMVVRIRD